jgi:hypothetical protein
MESPLEKVPEEEIKSIEKQPESITPRKAKAI